VGYKERAGGGLINRRTDTTRKQADFNAQYQLWPTDKIDALISNMSSEEFAEMFVLGMMHHSVGTERAVKAGKRAIKGKSQMNGKTLGTHAVIGSARQGIKYDVAHGIATANRSSGPRKPIRFKVESKHLEALSKRIISSKTIPANQYSKTLEALDLAYATTPDSELNDKKLKQAVDALMKYTEVISRANIGLAEQNDTTTVGPLAAGKFRLGEIASGVTLGKYLVSWGHDEGEVNELSFAQKRDAAKKYRVGGPNVYYYGLNEYCFDGPYAFNPSDRSNVDGDSDHGSIVVGGGNGSISGGGNGSMSSGGGNMSIGNSGGGGDEYVRAVVADGGDVNGHIGGDGSVGNGYFGGDGGDVSRRPDVLSTVAEREVLGSDSSDSDCV
jgi:hypothetical protein